VDAVASIRSWIDGASSACLVVGSTGAGKSHLLTSAARAFEEALVMPPPDGTDCSQFLETLKSNTGQRVVADDLDKFSKGLREEVIKLAAASSHLLLTSVTELSSRTRSVLSAKWRNVVFVFLKEPASRPEDVHPFVMRWATTYNLGADVRAVADCAAFCCASGLPQGFRTVEAFLEELVGSGWGFSGTLTAADAASAYRQAISPPPTQPTLLVEGYTDRLYLECKPLPDPMYPGSLIR